MLDFCGNVVVVGKEAALAQGWKKSLGEWEKWKTSFCQGKKVGIHFFDEMEKVSMCCKVCMHTYDRGCYIVVYGIDLIIYNLLVRNGHKYGNIMRTLLILTYYLLR